jgi:hypothetical protein
MTQIPTELAALGGGLTQNAQWRILMSFWCLAPVLHSDKRFLPRSRELSKSLPVGDSGDRAPDFQTGGEEIARC